MLLTVVLAACGRVGFHSVGDAGDVTDGTVADAAISVVLVSDDYDRTIASGWGNADVGGAWAVYNPDNSGVSVGSGHGDIAMSTSTAYVDCHVLSTTALDAETSVTIAYDRLPTTGSYEAAISVRWVTNGTDYRLHLHVLAGGSVDEYLERGLSGSYVTLATGPPITVTANVGLMLSLRATGASPTTLCGTLWPAGSVEPSTCTVATQDSTPQYQVPGISYLVTYDENGAPPMVSVATFRYLRIGPM